MPNCERTTEPEGQLHDICLATGMCRACGASRKAIASGERAPYCEPGVTGISWIRRAERFRDLMAGPTISVPLYRMADLPSLTGKRPSIAIVDDIDDEPPSAA